MYACREVHRTCGANLFSTNETRSEGEDDRLAAQAGLYLRAGLRGKRDMLGFAGHELLNSEPEPMDDLEMTQQIVEEPYELEEGEEGEVDEEEEDEELPSAARSVQELYEAADIEDGEEVEDGEDVEEEGEEAAEDGEEAEEGEMVDEEQQDTQMLPVGEPIPVAQEEELEEAEEEPLLVIKSPHTLVGTLVAAAKSPVTIPAMKSSPVPIATKTLVPVATKSPVPVLTKNPIAVATKSPVVAQPEPEQEKEESVKSHEALTPVGKFASVFESIWGILEKQGWTVAQSRDAMFCAMPGTQFFNFRPNVNVFDSKEKACWKIIALSAAVVAEAKAKGLPVPTNPTDEYDAAIWEVLWPVAEKQFGWYTMAAGPETWFVKPDTRFEEFRPNETIFQNKKLAVLRCLALEKVKVVLGESMEGPQVVDFSFPVKKKETKKKPPVKREILTSPDPVMRTPSFSEHAKKPSPRPVAALSRAKTPSPMVKRAAAVTKATPSTASKKKAPAKKGIATAGKRKKPAIQLRQLTPPKPAEPSFHIPEFRCTFGHVYGKMQQRGWYHKAGQFGYDYFSPEYTKDNAIQNGNFFHSEAELQDYIKTCGLWQVIEEELRDEHAVMVDLLRQEAEEKHQITQQRARARQQREAEAKKRTPMAKEAPPQDDPFALSPDESKSNNKKLAKVKQLLKAERAKPKVAKKKPSPRTSVAPVPTPRSQASFNDYRISMGKVIKKLVGRGWTYRPGRFEYDYFKPGVNMNNMKAAILNEDYFQSEAELETYLKVSGLWSEIARELQDEHFAEQERHAMEISQEEANRQPLRVPKRDVDDFASSQVNEVHQSSGSPKKQRVAMSEESANRTLPPASSLRPSMDAVAASPAVSSLPKVVNDHDVEELTNDIWANSHHFEFERR